MICEENSCASIVHQRRRRRERSRWWTEGPVYLCPKERYYFWTPEGMHGRELIDSVLSDFGHRCPQSFPSIWYINLEPVCARQRFIKIANLLMEPWFKEGAAAPSVRLFTSVEHLQELQWWEVPHCFRVDSDISNASVKHVLGLVRSHP